MAAFERGPASRGRGVCRHLLQALKLTLHPDHLPKSVAPARSNENRHDRLEVFFAPARIEMIQEWVSTGGMEKLESPSQNFRRTQKRQTAQNEDSATSAQPFFEPGVSLECSKAAPDSRGHFQTWGAAHEFSGYEAPLTSCAAHGSDDLGRRFRHGDQLAGGRTGAAAQLALWFAAGASWLLRGRFPFFPGAFLVEAFTAQADLAVAGIDAQHLDLDLVADLDDFLAGFRPCDRPVRKCAAGLPARAPARRRRRSW